MTLPSNLSACITHSTESVIISLLTKDARIPSCPIEIPSETEMVANSIGKPPAAITPAFAFSANRLNDILQGVISFQEEAIPIWGFLKSSSFIPTALNIARAGALSKPSVTSLLLGFKSPGLVAI